MKYVHLIILCIICSFSSIAQEQINLFEVRAGTWIPLGGLKNAFVAAPSLGFYGGLRMAENTALDLGVEFAFPVNSQVFTYYSSQKTFYEYTETNLFFSMGLRVRHQITLSKDIYLTPYAYLGANFLSTDIEDISYDDYGDEVIDYEFITTLDLSAGVSLRRKSVGCYIEFHHTPYNIGNKVDYGFGSSYVCTGINVCF